MKQFAKIGLLLLTALILLILILTNWGYYRRLGAFGCGD